MRFAIVGGAVLFGAGIAALLWLAAPSAEAGPTCTIYFTGATSNAWETASNWSLTDGGGSAGRVPNATDFACMSSSLTRSRADISADAAVAGIAFVNKPSVHPGLNLLAGTFTVGSSSGSITSTVNNFAMSDSTTLAGTADITATGPGTAIADGANLSGAADFKLAANTSVAVGSIKILEGRHVVNAGSMTLGDSSGSPAVLNGSLENAGTITFVGNRSGVSGSFGSGVLFKNDDDATLIVALTSPDAYARIYLPMDIGGTVTVLQGRFVLLYGGALSGKWNLSAGTTVEAFGAPELRAARAMQTSGHDAPKFTDGEYVASGLVVDGDGFFDLSSSLSGTATVKNAELLGVVHGPGVLTLAEGGTTTVSRYLYVRDVFRVVNRGILTVTGEAEDEPCLFIQTGGVLENAGTLALSVGCGSFESDGAAGNGFRNDAGATINVALDPGGSLDEQVPLTNNGTLSVSSGTFDVSALNSLDGAGTLSGGTYQTSGGKLLIPDSIVTNTADVVVSGGSILNRGNGKNALIALTTNSGSVSSAQNINLTGRLANTGRLTLTAGVFRPVNYTQTAGSTVVRTGATLKAGGSGTSAVAINGGVLGGNGTVQGTVSGAGTIHPGGDAGPLSVTGSYSAASSGTVAIDISGPSTPGTDFGQLSVSGNASLPNNLSITTTAGYLPPVGTTYSIVTAGSRSGMFTSITVQDLPNGTYYDVSYTPTSVVLTVRAAPAVSVGSVSVTEGNAGTSALNVPILLDAATDRPVSVSYQTVDGTATAGSDYVATSGTATIPAGSTSTTVPVTINGDTVYETDETFAVQLSSPVNAVLGTATATETILNDDVSVMITSLNPAAIGQNATGRTLTITGQNFTASSSVSVSGTGLTVGPPRFISATTLKVTISSAPTAPVGARDVTVSDPANGSATCAGCFSVNPKPAVSSTTPASLQQGAANVEVSVPGSALQPGATVMLVGPGGQFSVATSYVSSSSLNAFVTVNPATAVGTYTVRVTNPDGGRGNCTNCFTVTAGPSVTSITPSTVARGTVVNVTITGTNFTPGARMSGPNGVTFDAIVVVNSTTITATMTVSDDAPTGPNQTVTVTNPLSAGAGSATLNGLTITA